jgi:hypothetical protein
MPDAFKHEDGSRVPLVWQHGHSDPKNVLGHAILEHREDGMYAYGYFNNTQTGESSKALVQHKDITQLSIYANKLVQKGSHVLHGSIREVSLVLAGANPGALIDNVAVAHSDGEIETLEDEAIIYTGLPLEHKDLSHGEASVKDEKLSHASQEKKEKDVPEDDRTVEDVFNTLTDEQKELVYFMIGAALEEANSSAEQSGITHTEGIDMNRNVFEQDGAARTPTHTLSHSDINTIVSDAIKGGSLKDAVEAYAMAHGIDDIDVLFPEARAITGTPEWLTRRSEWVADVLGGARKSPFARIKTVSADLTYDEARARGYIKGTVKKEEFFGVAKRITTPTTIYKKQQLDRDDMIDITDFDVVAWLKGEMRLMLDEEIARAILIGDGRDVASTDKISETNLRPIATDDDFYTVKVPVDLANAESSPTEVVDAVILARHFYKGSGLPTFYTTESLIGQLMAAKDTQGRRLYRNVSEVAAEMRVRDLVAVGVLEETPEVIGIMVNMADYVIGADRGGEVSLFDDFDIDYNKYKYLIETRISGALVKAKSALVVVQSGNAEVLAKAPTWNPDTGVVTIPSVAGVQYVDASDESVLTAGAITVDPLTSITIQAEATSGKILSPAERTRWTFRNRNQPVPDEPVAGP